MASATTTAAVNSAGLYNPIQNYTSMVQLGDYLDSTGLDSSNIFTSDIGSLSLFGSNPLFNNSIYGGGMNTLGLGGMGLGGIGMGGMYGWTQSEWQEYNNLTSPEDRADFIVRRNAAYTDATAKAETKSQQIKNKEDWNRTSFENRVVKQISTLRTTIRKNDQTHIYEEYTRLYNAVAEKLINEGAISLPEGKTIADFDETTKDRIATEAQILYAEHSDTNMTITEEIEKYGDGELVTGLKNGTLGLGFLFNPSGKTAKDNIVAITNVDDRTKGDKALKYLGMGATGLLSLALLAKGTPMILGGLKTGGNAVAHSTAKSWAKLFGKETAKVAGKKGSKAAAEKAGGLLTKLFKGLSKAKVK